MPQHPGFLDEILTLASGPSLARGHDYADRGLVSDLQVADGAVRATVHGTADYSVRLDADGSWCDCPHAMDGNLCKHAVAVALTAGASADPADLASPAADLASFLNAQSHERLVELLLESAAADEMVEHRLLLAAAEASGDLAALRAEVDAVLGGRRFLDYYAATDYVVEARDVIAALDRAAKGADAAGAIPVIERAIRHAVRAVLRADDSSGGIGGLVYDLLDIHGIACRRGLPDPRKLARWLIRFSFDDQDMFRIDVRDYAKALGDVGLKLYREEVHRRREADPDNFAARDAAEQFALLDRDAEAVVRLFGGALTSPYNFSRVAEAMLEIDRPDDALHWARQGMQLPTTWQSRALYDLAATVHAKRGEVDQTVAVRREGLDAIPDLTSYVALRKAAESAGQWPAHRPEALDVLASRAPQSHVQALFSDGDVDRAWTAATGPGADVDAGTMRQLAERRAKTHPADAAPYYQLFALDAVRGADRQAYRESARWLTQLRKLHERAGTLERFDALLAELRLANRRRPAFLDELRRAGL